MTREHLIMTFFKGLIDEEAFDLLTQYINQQETKQVVNRMQGNFMKTRQVVRTDYLKQNSNMADDSIVNESDESSFNFAGKRDLSESHHWEELSSPPPKSVALQLPLDIQHFWNVSICSYASYTRNTVNPNHSNSPNLAILYVS